MLIDFEIIYLRRNKINTQPLSGRSRLAGLTPKEAVASTNKVSRTVSTEAQKLFLLNQNQFEECIKVHRKMPLFGAAPVLAIKRCFSDWHKREAALLEHLQANYAAVYTKHGLFTAGLRYNRAFIGVTTHENSIEVGLSTNSVKAGLLIERNSKKITPFAEPSAKDIVANCANTEERVEQISQHRFAVCSSIIKERSYLGSTSADLELKEELLAECLNNIHRLNDQEAALRQNL